MLEVLDVHKAYGTNTVLEGATLKIATGEVTALLGVNGAGKSTLLSIVAGLTKPDRGRVLVNGRDSHDPSTRRLLGVAPQTLGIYPTMTVRRNLTLFGRLAGCRGRKLRTRIERTAEAMGLEDLVERRAGELSGGQQRRLHTAMAMVGEPRLLLLDEPTVGADVASRARILKAVRRFAEQGCAICYTSHHLEEIEHLGANLAVLQGGRIVVAGTRHELGARTPDDDHSIEAIYDHFVRRPPPHRADPALLQPSAGTEVSDVA